MPNARPKGWGAFLRAGASDGNPNFLKFTVSGGLAGDNPARKQDTWGAGGFYRKRSDVLLLKELGLGSECGVEAYYNAGITPWCHVSGHVQYIDTGLPRADNGILFGIRTKIDF